MWGEGHKAVPCEGEEVMVEMDEECLVSAAACMGGGGKGGGSTYSTAFNYQVRINSINSIRLAAASC